MKHFRFSKLVRDKIVDFMQVNKQFPRGVRTLDKDEFISELIKKLIEEAEEMHGVNNIEELKKELADVLEVIDYLKKELKVSNEEMIHYQNAKKKKNGGFDKKIFVEEIELDEDNEWYQYYKSQPDKYPEIKDK